MKKRLWITLPIVVLALGLASCGNLPQPVCPTESLVAPVLAAPAQMTTINTVQPTLSWSYPGNCHPEGYRIDLSVTADLSDTSLSGGTGNPSTSWGPGEDLSDCTQYYWRVAPINDVTLGPFSETRTFSVDVSGSCTPSGGTASIAGLVWHDLCAVPTRAALLWSRAASPVLMVLPKPTAFSRPASRGLRGFRWNWGRDPARPPDWPRPQQGQTARTRSPHWLPERTASRSTPWWSRTSAS